MHFGTQKGVRAVSRMLYSKRDTARHARYSTSRLARQARHHERDRRDTQLSLFVMCIKL